MSDVERSIKAVSNKTLLVNNKILKICEGLIGHVGGLKIP